MGLSNSVAVGSGIKSESFRVGESMKTLFAILIIASPLCLQAQSGKAGSGGGDVCESRLQSVRGDLKVWISNDGASVGNLRLPKDVAVEDYKKTMLRLLDETRIEACARGTEQTPNPVTVSGAPKVCRWDRISTGFQITCDEGKIMGDRNHPPMATEELYELMHHEYASLAGFEPPEGPRSSYVISTQISAFLEFTVVKKLAVKPIEPDQMPIYFCHSLAMTKTTMYDKSLGNVRDVSLYQFATLSTQQFVQGQRQWVSVGGPTGRAKMLVTPLHMGEDFGRQIFSLTIVYEKGGAASTQVLCKWIQYAKSDSQDIP